MIARRSFIQTLTAVAAGSALRAQATQAKIKLGYDNFAVRAMGWKAAQLLDYAARLKCDTLFISDLDALGDLGEASLRETKEKADDLGIGLYVGSWSICPTSTSFKNKWGTAEEHLRTGIKVSRALGSPVFRVILGAAKDRSTPGGIRARIADTVAVLKTCEKDARDAGIKIAVENHAGDMHSWELADLVTAAGPEFVGVNFDSGNAAWTLEDPVAALERLAPMVCCSSLRDDMVWPTENGAAVQWTAVGEGLVDWTRFMQIWRQHCAKVPFMIETIGGFSRGFDFKKPDFWKDYDRRDAELAKFEAMAAHGKKLDGFKAPEGADKKIAEQEFQRGELERSLAFCREKLGLGVKS